MPNIPDDWLPLYCPNGHEVQTYLQTEGHIDLLRVDMYGICAVCGTPWRYRWCSAEYRPEVYPLPSPDGDKPIDLPFIPFPKQTGDSNDEK